MKRKNTSIELLAPAKNLDLGVAAINSGADAVYTGAPAFTARASAVNSYHEIEKLADYCHFYNAKTYVAFNTIIYENELEEARKMIYRLWDAGVDALIFQDPSLLEMDIPPIELHASTQCHNYDLERIKFWADNGVSRIILARELGLNSISNINSEIEAETEVFIHGALCWSLSGQCYMSRYIGDRSANRGNCAQPCRKEWTLLDKDGKVYEKNKYLLSLKDMNRSGYIEELIDAGVSSLKIEGRLKDIDYVKNVTSYYRRIIDGIIQKKNYNKTSSGNVFLDFKSDSAKTFNRGYISYHFKEGEMQITYNSPKSLGEFIGVVKFSKENRFILEKDSDLIPGDGICFISKNNLIGASIYKVLDKEIYIENDNIPEIGTKIYRNNNSEFTKLLLKRDSAIRKIALKISAENNTILVKDEDGNAVKRDISEQDQIKNIDSFKKTFEKSFSKTGDTNFIVENIYLADSFSPFIPVSKMNELRRNMIEELNQLRISNYSRKTTKNITISNYFKNEISCGENVVNSLSRKFYEKRGVKIIRSGYDLEPDPNYPVMTSANCVLKNIGLCKKTTNIKEPLYLTNDYGDTFELDFNCEECIMTLRPFSGEK